jgi:hypothetical protein
MPLVDELSHGLEGRMLDADIAGNVRQVIEHAAMGSVAADPQSARAVRVSG